MRNFKQLLLFAVLLACVQAYAGGTSTYYSQVKVTVSPTGAGKVYATDNDTPPAEGDYTEEFTTAVYKSTDASKTVSLYALPAADYKFLGWQDASGNLLSVENPYKATYKAGSTTEGNPTIISYTAKFGQTLVTASSSDVSLGTASIDKLENKIGDQVKVTAVPYSLNSVFVGWTVDGADDVVSTANPYTFTVSDAAKYTAKFKKIRENGRAYYRIYSTTSKKFLRLTGTTFVNADKPTDGYTGAIFLNSIEIKDNQNYNSDAGTIFYVDGTPNGQGLTTMVLGSQGVDTKTIMAENKLSYDITLTYDISKSVYKAYINILGERYLKDGAVYGGRSTGYAIFCGGDDSNTMLLQPLTEETMDTYYFGAKPSSNMEHEGKYWTTMYTSFPYECKDGVEAYYVASLQQGTPNVARLRKIDSGLVPANTAVILACQTTEPKTNRLVPYTGEVAELSDNLLKGSFQLNSDKTPKVTFDGSSMRVLNKNSQGIIGFYKLEEGKEMTANKAWLDISSLPSAQAAKGFVMAFGDATGIQEVGNDAVTGDNFYYDLQGRRVEHPSHGIYIHNGKKVVVR